MTHQRRRSSRLFVCLAAAGLLAVASCSTDERADAGHSGEQTITKLTKSMLVDASALPNIDGGEWTVGKIRSEDTPPQPDKYIPPQCAPLVGSVEHTQRVSVRFLPSKDSWTRAINLWLYVTPNPPDVKTLLPQCGSLVESVNKDNPAYSPQTFVPAVVPDIPPWTVAADQEGSVYVMGSYRGVFLLADFAPERTDGTAPGLVDS